MRMDGLVSTPPSLGTQVILILPGYSECHVYFKKINKFRNTQALEAGLSPTPSPVPFQALAGAVDQPRGLVS